MTQEELRRVLIEKGPMTRIEIVGELDYSCKNMGGQISTQLYRMRLKGDIDRVYDEKKRSWIWFNKEAPDAA